MLWPIFLLLLVPAIMSWARGRPWFWRHAIRRFEALDRVAPPKPGVIVFAGSSSINFWNTLVGDMKPLEVINRGFGGSQLAQVNYHAKKIVLPYRPRAVVLYAGENDLSWPWSKTPQTVFADFKSFLALVQGALPQAYIYFISIKPSPRRRRLLPKQREANRLIEEFCGTQPRAQFIDVAAAMLDKNGEPRAEFFVGDGVHPNARCYELWTSIIKPILLRQFEVVPAQTQTPSPVQANH
jgi:lysophospholipase L1-like esterase